MIIHHRVLQFCAWKDAVLQHPEQCLQTHCSTSTGNSRPYAALAPEALERIAARIKAVQPVRPSSADLENWQDMALVLQNSIKNFFTEQVRQGALVEPRLLTG